MDMLRNYGRLIHITQREEWEERRDHRAVGTELSPPALVSLQL